MLLDPVSNALLGAKITTPEINTGPLFREIAYPWYDVPTKVFRAEFKFSLQ
jgi:hypothetical protein